MESMDFDRRHISHREWFFGNDSNAQRRDVPGESVDWIRRCRAFCNDERPNKRDAANRAPIIDQPLLLNSDGERWGTKSLSNMVARVAAGVGILRLRVSAHKLRHTREVIDRRAGLDPATRARLRARSSIRSLDRYEHVLPEELPDAREIANQGLRDYLGEPFLPTADEAAEERKEHDPTTRPNTSADQTKRTI